MKAGLAVVPNKEELNRMGAALICEQSRRAIKGSGRFTIALSGGSTPKSVYAELASPQWRNEIEWSGVHFYWGDERCVPITHPDSNYAMVQRELLSKIQVPPGNVHRFPVELNDPVKIAAAYEQDIRRNFGDAGIPQFDLILLGLGENGHTASLFPHCPALHVKDRLVVADWVEEVKAHRLTFTAPLINAGRQIAFLVSGAGKAQVLHDVMKGPYQPELLPAQLIAPTDGILGFIADSAAARLAFPA